MLKRISLVGVRSWWMRELLTDKPSWLLRFDGEPARLFNTDPNGQSPPKSLKRIDVLAPYEDVLVTATRVPSVPTNVALRSLALNIEYLSPWKAQNTFFTVENMASGEDAMVYAVSREQLEKLVAPSASWRKSMGMPDVMIDGFWIETNDGHFLRLNAVQNAFTPPVRPVAWLAGAVAITVAVILLATTALRLFSAMDEAKKLAQQIAADEQVIAQLQATTTASKPNDSFVEFETPPPLSVLRTLTAALPDQAFIQAVTISGAKIQGSIVSSDSSTILRSLSSDPQVANIDVLGAIRRDAAGLDHFSVEIDLLYDDSSESHLNERRP